MLGKKRDCYDIFTGSREEKELLAFSEKQPLEMWKELMLEADSYMKEAVIAEGFRMGFCDKNGSLTTTLT
jgi:hypothetical protein